MHLTVGADVNPLHTDNFERVSFGPILYEARKLNMQIHTRYEVADHASESIVRIVNDEPFDFLLVGAGISMSNFSFDMDTVLRSEERRVGKECRSRWSPYH